MRQRRTERRLTLIKHFEFIWETHQLHSSVKIEATIQVKNNDTRKQYTGKWLARLNTVKEFLALNRLDFFCQASRKKFRKRFFREYLQQTNVAFDTHKTIFRKWLSAKIEGVTYENSICSCTQSKSNILDIGLCSVQNFLIYLKQFRSAD